MVSKSYSISLLNAGIIEDVDISKIVSSPRFYLSIPTNLNDLSESIRKKGLLQAIIVRTKQGHYEVVAGNRRYLACKKLGWRKILCHIVELDDREAFEISLIENIQRRTINPIEEAHAFRNYISNYGWGSISELAARIGKSVSYVDKRIRLLTLPNSVLEKVTGSLLNVSTVEELIPINDENRQSALADLIYKRRMSIKQVRQLIKNSENSDYEHDNVKPDDISYLDRKARKSFDKSIITLRIAMNRLTEIIQSSEDNWILHDIFMEHRNALHARIDLLIKQKRKLYSPINEKKCRRLLPCFTTLLLIFQLILMNQ